MSCAYDEKRIELSVDNDGIKVDIVKNRPFIYAIVKKEFEVTICSDATLKKLLQISNTHDIMLTITSTDATNSKTSLIINDNGQDYITFDKHEYNVQSIKTSFSKIIKN